jgi:hypothetical protein
MITVRQVAFGVTRRTMESAREGSLLRVGGDTPAMPARVVGGAAPFNLANNSVLRLAVNGANVDVVLRGQSAEAVAGAALADPVAVDDTNRNFRVVINGVAQAISLEPGNPSRADLVMAINRRLRGGYARLTDADDAPTEQNRLVIGSDRMGTSSSAGVIDAVFGFAANTTAGSPPGPDNNVADLEQVTVQELNALLTGPPDTRVRASSSEGRLVLSTAAAGADATLAVIDASAANTVSAHLSLGLTPLAAGGQPNAGSAGMTLAYYVKAGGQWVDSGGNPLNLPGADPADAPAGGAQVVTLSVIARDGDGEETLFDGLDFDARSSRFAGRVMAVTPTRRSESLSQLFALDVGSNVGAFQLRQALFPGGQETNGFILQQGNDGAEPASVDYERCLGDLAGMEDISIVAAPGYSALSSETEIRSVQNALISHGDARRSYRIVVLDSIKDQGIAEVRTQKSQIDSTHAALYFPWVIVANPLARPGQENAAREIALPPSGFVCGIYARSDGGPAGVAKAPANEVVRGALRFEINVNFAQQEVLNPLGVNCLRFLPGRGYRVWGARTISSDPEWKYVNVRRYFNYLEASIDRGTQWAVFEPNGERLWANIRETVSSFLLNEWVSGRLLGRNPEEAFFVRCDRSTMTQNDLDNGRLICLIGVAPLTPAEFVIFRIGQKTADSRS